MPEASSNEPPVKQTSPILQTSVDTDDVLPQFVKAIEYTPFVAIQSFNRDGTILLWNTTSANLYGIQKSDALGRLLSDLLFDKNQTIEFLETIKRIWDSGQPELPRDWKIKTPMGKEVWVYSTMFPDIRGGKVQQIFCMDVDITVRKREEQELLALGSNLRNLFERSSDAIMLIEDDRFLDVNPAALQLFGYANKSDMVGRYPKDFSPLTQPDGQASKEKSEKMMALARKHGNHRFEWLHSSSNQQTFWAEVLLTEILTNNKPLLYAVVRDISARKAAEQSLQLAAQAFENSHEGILIADKEQKIISVNRALCEITGYPESEMLGKKPQFLYSSLQDPVFFQSILEQINTHNHWQSELWGCHRDGHGYPFSISVTAVRDSHDEIINYIAILTDISQHNAAKEKMQHMVEHDSLTGLPNRILLLDRLQQAITIAERHHTKLTILFLDLDRFKYINDSFGHHVGDKLLKTVAERLTKCVRSVDTVCRLGGDEFIIMLVDVGNGEVIAHIADNILNAINVPYEIEGCDFSITTSIGISTYPGDSVDMDTLIKNADTAMYHAKENGANCYEFFNHDMNTRIVERIMLENNLRSALSKQEFILHYQPCINFIGDQTVGAEALIRWRHPTFGLIFPDRFISVAEECGLIVPIGDWVLRTACLQAKSWQEKGIRLAIAVNLSVAQFHQKSLLQSVIDALQAAKLEPQYLELEITESILMDEEKSAIETLHALRDMGVKVSIDDFGTGFSSLSYLKHIPVDKLKIDQSFVQDISIDAEDAAIIDAIIVMAKGLNLQVIAEGVETIEQFRFLKSHGCDEYQGYYSSRELPPQEFLEFVTSAA